MCTDAGMYCNDGSILGLTFYNPIFGINVVPMAALKNELHFKVSY